MLTFYGTLALALHYGLLGHLQADEELDLAPQGGKGPSETKAKYSTTAQIAFRNIPNLQEIIDSVVSTNISRATPPPSRPNTPPPRKPLSRASSRLHLGQPAQGYSTLQNTSSTPAEKWSSLSSRRSNRRFDVRPWGPRHLEYDYNEARKEFQSAAYYALGHFGYVPPNRTAVGDREGHC